MQAKYNHHVITKTMNGYRVDKQVKLYNTLGEATNAINQL